MIKKALAMLVVAGLSFSGTGCLSHYSGALPGEPQAATFAQVEGARIHYLDIGQGPVVVLIHGYGASLESWRPVINVLSKTNRVLALDLKGFGWSDRPPGDYSLAAQARIVLGVMTHRGVTSAAIVGQSYGAAVALAVVTSAPKRVTRVALYDGLAFEDQMTSFMQWARSGAMGHLMYWLYFDKAILTENTSLAFYDQKFVTADLLDSVERAMDRPGAKAGAYAVMRDLTLAKQQTLYGSVQQPVLLVWGREDRVTPLKYGERLAGELANAKLVVYPHCGHLPQFDAPQSTKALAAFLAEGQP